MSNWIWGMDLYEDNNHLLSCGDKIVICPKCRETFPRNFKNYNYCPNCNANMKKDRIKE